MTYIHLCKKVSWMERSGFTSCVAEGMAVVEGAAMVTGADDQGILGSGTEGTFPALDFGVTVSMDPDGGATDPIGDRIGE